MPSQIHAIIFDLDGTLYPQTAPLFTELRRLTKQLVATHTGHDASTIDDFYTTLSTTFPNPFCGLKSIGIDSFKYSTEVFAKVDIASLLTDVPNPRNLLERIRQKKFIVSFAPTAHIVSVLQHLRLTDLFACIYSIPEINSLSGKAEVYDSICYFYGLSRQQILIIGDNFEADLRDAASKGMKTVLIGSSGVTAHLEEILAAVL